MAETLGLEVTFVTVEILGLADILGLAKVFELVDDTEVFLSAAEVFCFLMEVSLLSLFGLISILASLVDDLGLFLVNGPLGMELIADEAR